MRRLVTIRRLVRVVGHPGQVRVHSAIDGLEARCGDLGLRSESREAEGVEHAVPRLNIEGVVGATPHTVLVLEVRITRDWKMG